MKKFLFTIGLVAFSIAAMAQAKKPTLMVVPSDVWCNQHGYVIRIDNMGQTQIVPDYQTALQNDVELKMAIATINDMMAQRGFPLKDMEQTLKSIQLQNAEQNMMTSKNGNEMAESATDRLLRTAKSDIVLELTWSLKEEGPKRILSYILEGKDAYTGKSIGAATGVSEPSFSADIAILLNEAVTANIDNFNIRLQSYFDDLFANGREITMEVRVFDGNAAGIDLETEYNGNELSEDIDRWMALNTVKGRFTKGGSSENYILYEQVRIPVYDNSGIALDAEGFGRQLRKVLRKEPYNVPVKLVGRGLGRVMLILGEK